jgi:CubicO group peptidase (beta-lactamase class C family)
MNCTNFPNSTVSRINFTPLWCFQRGSVSPALAGWVLALVLFILYSGRLESAIFPGKEWEKMSAGEASAAGWSAEKLADLRVFSNTLETEAVVVVTNGKILASWGATDKKFNVHSIRKSMLSALCGIEVAEGRLDLNWTLEKLGIDDNELSLSAVEKLAPVHDLMKARSGVYHSALYETASMKARRPVRHSHRPGEFWYYNNWDFNAMGSIYEQFAGGRIHEQFHRRIAVRIGMEDYQPADGRYVTGPESIHPAYPFRMSARDLARFGLLYLRQGKWHDESIIPAGWVRNSLVSYSNAGGAGGYGYYWWISRNGAHFPGVTLPDGSYSARGAGGHYLVVIPKLDLVVVHRVDTSRSGRQVTGAQFGQFMRRLIDSYNSPPGSLRD